MASINEIIQSAIDRVKLKGSDTWIKWSFWTRAKDVELNSGKNVETAVSELDENISNEIDRATDRENEIETALNSEITRAKSAESTLSTSINNEITRAKNAESTLETNKVPITRTINGKALSSDITLLASDVGADASGSANTALTNAKAYTDTKVADLVGTAPETLDTLEELADALKDNADIVDVLNESIATKANASDLTSHASNTTVHITSTERTNWNDANSKKHTHSNKSILDNTTASYTTAEQTKLSGIATGAEVNQNAFSNVVVGSTTISADSKTDSLTLAGSNVTLTPDTTNDKVTIGITKANVTSALGYTPPTTNTTYGVATSSALGLVKSGTDITVDSSGNVSVNDDSHNHVISNVDGLQSALDGKSVNKTLTNENLNNVTTPGFYNAGGGNTVTNKPSGIEHFGLIVIHRASGAYYTQIIFNDTSSYRRFCVNGTWGSWAQDKLTDTNTWRGIQNNLTSDSTTDSLSAAQGKVLKGLVDGKAASSHTHNYAGSSSAGGAATTALACTGNSETATNADMIDGYHAKSFPISYSFSGANNAAKWVYLGDITASAQAEVAIITVYSGNGYNADASQNSLFKIMIKKGYQSTASSTNTCAATVYRINCSSVQVKVMASASNKYSVYVYFPWKYWNGNYTIEGQYKSYTHVGSNSSNEPSDGVEQSVAHFDYAFESSTVSAATALTTSAGSATQPVYFSGGKPVACTSLDLNTSGNAATATKLATARTIALTGSVTGSGSFDGSGNLSIATTTNHTHNYLPLAGGTVDYLNVSNTAKAKSLLLYLDDGATTVTGMYHSATNEVIYSSTGLNKAYSSHILKIGSSSGSMYGSGTHFDLDTQIRGRYIALEATKAISSSVSIVTSSDEKVKSFTEDITTDEEKLVELFDIIKPKSYNYKYSKANSLSIGFSAQEIEQAMIDLDIDPEKYGILNIQYGHMLSRGDDEEDGKYYTKFYEISYNDLFNLSLLKMHVMEKEHVARLESIEKRLAALENK